MLNYNMSVTFDWTFNTWNQQNAQRQQIILTSLRKRVLCRIGQIGQIGQIDGDLSNSTAAAPNSYLDSLGDLVGLDNESLPINLSIMSSRVGVSQTGLIIDGRKLMAALANKTIKVRVPYKTC